MSGRRRGSGGGARPAAGQPVKAKLTIAQKEDVTSQMMTLLQNQIDTLQLAAGQRSSALGEDKQLLDVVMERRQDAAHRKRAACSRRAGATGGAGAGPGGKSRELEEGRTGLAYPSATRRRPKLPLAKSGAERSPLSSIYDGGVTIDKLLPPETLGKLERSGAQSAAVAASMELEMTEKKETLRGIERRLQAMGDGSLIRLVDDVHYDHTRPPPFELAARSLFEFTMAYATMRHGKSLMAGFMRHPLVCDYLTDVFWLMHCRFFQARSQPQQEYLARRLAHKHVKLVEVAGGHADFLLRRFPTLLGAAVIWAFFYLCPGSRHRFHDVLKTQMYLEINATVTGTDVTPQSVQLQRRDLFPEEHLGSQHINRIFAAAELAGSKRQRDPSTRRGRWDAGASRRSSRRASTPAGRRGLGGTLSQSAPDVAGDAQAPFPHVDTSAAVTGGGRPPRFRATTSGGARGPAPAAAALLQRAVTAGGGGASPGGGGTAPQWSRRPLGSSVNRSMTALAQRLDDEARQHGGLARGAAAEEGGLSGPEGEQANAWSGATAETIVSRPPNAFKGTSFLPHGAVRERQVRARFHSGQVHPLVETVLRDKMGSAPPAMGSELRQSKPVPWCRVGGEVTFSASRGVGDDHGRAERAYREQVRQSTRAVSRLQREMQENREETRRRRRALQSRGVAAVAKYSMDLVKRQEVQAARDALERAEKAKRRAGGHT